MRKKLGKIFSVFGVLFLLLIACVLILPVLVDVDKYRPEITRAANQRLHGKLELGKLSLSLLGKVQVHVNGFQLNDAQGREVVKADDAYFHLPLLSLLSGSPEMTLRVKEPDIHVVKEPSGELNVMTLVKEAPPAEQAQPQTPASGGAPVRSEAEPSEKRSLPGIVTRARLNLDLVNSRVIYRDQVSGSLSEVKALNVIAHDLSLSRPTHFSVWADLDTKIGSRTGVKGPFRLDGNATPRQTQDGKLKVDYQAKLTVTDLRIQSPTLKAEPTVNVLVQIATDQLEKILVTLKAPGNDLKIEGKLVSFEKPRLDLEVNSPGMDLDQLVVFEEPVQSQSQTQVQNPNPNQKPEYPSAPSQSKNAANPKKQSAGVAAREDLDLSLAPVRDSAILSHSVGNMGVHIKMLKAQNVSFQQIECKLSFKELTANLNACEFGLFSGKVKPSAQFHLKSKTPTYDFKAEMKGLDLAQAIQSRMPLLKNTVVGKAQMNVAGQGASLNPDAAKANLKAHGSMKVDQAVFATIDIAKMVQEGLNRALQQIGEKVPAARGKTLQGKLPSNGSKYETITSDFTIVDGKFNAPNFSAKAVANQGVDLKGNAVIGIQDYSLKSQWEVIDTYNLTRARDISAELAGTKIDHILASGDSPVHFPVSVGCTIMKPCYSYEDTQSALLKVALSNVNLAMKGKAGEELRKKADNFLKNAPPDLQEKLKGLFQ